MKLKNALLLTLTAFIWGTAFVAQSVGMDYIGPFTFNGVRSFIGAVALLPCVVVLNGKRHKNLKQNSDTIAGSRNGDIRSLIIGGVLCGLCLFVASSLQQVGLKYTSAGKAGFITACYIVLVPVFGIFMKKKAGIKVWASVVIAVAGLYCLCIKDGFTIERGDIYIFLCAVVFAVHILVIDYYSPKVDGVMLSCIQFLVCGILSLPFMFILETPDMSAICSAWLPILYAGVLSSGVAYTLQIIGQKDVNPTIASLILSLESCFSVLAGWVILHERLSIKECIGCVLMFAAITLTLGQRGQVPVSQEEK